jgi:hypothetical protein
MTMAEIVQATNIIDLMAAEGSNPVLAYDGSTVFVTERVTARLNHWPILAYRIDLIERYPEGITIEQAQAEADAINRDLETLAAAFAAKVEGKRKVPMSEIAPGVFTNTEAVSFDVPGPAVVAFDTDERKESKHRE